MKKSKVIVVTLVTLLSMNSQVFAKSISLNELQNSQANYIPAVNITAKEINSGHWAYKSLENITRKYGLLIGDAGEKFDGSKPLTRNEAAVILVNLIGKVEQEKINIDESEKTQIGILKNELSGEINALIGRVATLEKEVDKLEGTVSKVQDNDKKTFKTAFGENFKIGGAFQVKYTGNVQKGADNYTPNFQLPLEEFRFSGKLAPHLNYLASMNSQRTWNGGAATGTATTTGILGDGYVSTDIIPNHIVYLGQTRTPIGIEGPQSPTTMDTIDKAQIARNFSDGRDIGIKVAGTYPMADYFLGVYNGSGQNYRDVSSNMALGGWAIAKPLYKLPKYGKLELGTGYWRQQNGNSTNTTLSSRFETQTWGANLAYTYKKVGLKSEWAMRRGYTAQSQIARGMFTQATYDLNKKVQLLAKYDIFDPNQRSADNTLSEYTLGTNYFFAGNNIKLQVNAVAVQNPLSKDSKRIMVLTQYAF